MSSIIHSQPGAHHPCCSSESRTLTSTASSAENYIHRYDDEKEWPHIVQEAVWRELDQEINAAISVPIMALHVAESVLAWASISTISQSVELFEPWK
jgi:hypothetical protein